MGRATDECGSDRRRRTTAAGAPHTVEEPLYRKVGVRNGPTIKPIELRVGIVGERLTPDLARIAGELYADDNSRRLERILTAVGMRPPSRAVLEKRIKLVAEEIAERAEELEATSRAAVRIPAEVASVSCGLDRFAVRMAEPASEETLDTRPPPRRTTPYVRAVPPPKDHHWRMAWVGTVSTYDRDGKELDTWCYTAEAGADPSTLARRAAADVLSVLEVHPTAPVHVVQDGAPELRVLPKTLADTLPASTTVRTLIDFEHLAGYLDDVVVACEPEGDPYNMKSWYRGELLRDDAAIERIQRSLRRSPKMTHVCSSKVPPLIVVRLPHRAAAVQGKLATLGAMRPWTATSRRGAGPMSAESSSASCQEPPTICDPAMVCDLEC